MKNTIIFQTPDELVQATAARVVEIAAQSIAARGVFSLALAGGSTPRALYKLLASDAWRTRIDWQNTHVCFGDERAVVPDSDDSNYRMARESLLNHIDVPPQNIHHMIGEAADLDAAARDYEAQLRALPMPLDLVPLDLVLLGMGDDGHTASLFPGTPALRETQRWCVATDVAPLEPHVRRLTLTYPVLNAARHIFVIVTGKGKMQRAQAVLQGPRDIEKMPVQGIEPIDGELVRMLDADAAALL